MHIFFNQISTAPTYLVYKAVGLLNLANPRRLDGIPDHYLSGCWPERPQVVLQPKERKLLLSNVEVSTKWDRRIVLFNIPLTRVFSFLEDFLLVYESIS